MCRRRAEKKEKQALPTYYLTHPLWSHRYQHQLVLAYRLLANYEMSEIWAALHTPNGHQAYSLAYDELIPMLEQERLDRRQKAAIGEAQRREALERPIVAEPLKLNVSHLPTLPQEPKKKLLRQLLG
jgi:hypothetical protein